LIVLYKDFIFMSFQLAHDRSCPARAATMNLAPLLDAAPAMPLHALVAMGAFALGVVQFAAPKGTLPHRTLGWIWVGLMAAVAVSSFWIHQIRMSGRGARSTCCRSSPC